MKIKLSDHFTYNRLLRFTLPSVVMMVVASIYSVVDGLFVSNLVGDLALSAVNIIFPVTMIIGAFGFMLGTGGSAIVARTLGEGRKELAQEYFSMLIYTVLVVGGILSVVSVVLTEPIARLAGASDLLIDDCVAYGRIMLAGSVVFMLQVLFQSFFVVAERPQLGLFFSVAAGVTNMGLDYVFIALMDLGIAGAALATVAGYCVGGVIPLIYFLTGERSGLRLGKTKLYGRQLLQACANGSSELMSNISSSIVSILYNLQLMRLIGRDGCGRLFCDDVRGLCLYRRLPGLLRGQRPHCQLPLRGGQPQRAEKRLSKKRRHHRGDRRGDGHRLGASQPSPLLRLCGLRPGAAGDDGPRLPSVCPELPVLRREHLCLCLLHRTMQRSHLRPHLLCPHPAAAGRDGPAAASVLGPGRHLVGGGCRRGTGCSSLSGLPDLPAQALPLRIKNSAFLSGTRCF